MGSCTYGIGTITNLVTTAKGNLSGEVKEFSHAMYQARALAFSRMQFEADELGADGIIINLMGMQYKHGNQWVEAAVKGTALRYVGPGGNKLPSKPGQVVIGIQ